MWSIKTIQEATGVFVRDTKYSLVTSAMMPWKLILEMSSAFKDQIIDFAASVTGAVTNSRFWASLMHPELSEVWRLTESQLALLGVSLDGRMGLRWPLGVTGQGTGQKFLLGSMSASDYWVLIVTWDLPVCMSGWQNRAESWSFCLGCAGEWSNRIFPITSSPLAASLADFQFS